MAQNFRGTAVARAMGMTSATFFKHYRNGMTTEPSSFEATANGDESPLWTVEDKPALDAHGASVVVPITEDIGVGDADRGYYMCPNKTAGHPGQWTNISSVGLYQNKKVDFYPVDGSISISPLDPVLKAFADLMDDDEVTVEEGEAILAESLLSEEEAEILLEACVQRWVDVPDEDADEEDGVEMMKNPARYTFFPLDIDNPIAVGVPSDPIRRYRFTFDDPDELDGPLQYVTLDEIAAHVAPDEQE